MNNEKELSTPEEQLLQGLQESGHEISKEPEKEVPSNRGRVEHTFYGPFLSEIKSEMFIEKAPIRKTHLMHRLEERLGEPLEEVLARMYYDEEKGAHTIARELGKSPSTINQWLRKCGIEVRDAAEANWVSRERRGEAMRKAFRRRLDEESDFE